MTTTSTYSDETAAIFGYLESGWAATAIAYPNAQFTPVTAGANGTSQPYIRPMIRRQPAFNASVARDSKLVRHPGLLVIEVRVPENTGDGVAMDLGSDLADMFRNLGLAPSIHFRAATVRDLGPDGRGWYLVQVEVPFYRDSIH